MNTSLTHEDTTRLPGMHPYQEALYRWLTNLRIFIGAGFYRSADQIASLHYQGIHCFPSLWKQVCWARDRNVTLPAIPKDTKSFDAFLHWVIKGHRVKKDRELFWELVTAAKFSPSRIQIIAEENSILTAIGKDHWTGSFVSELTNWLASFLPPGKPILKCEEHEPCERWRIEFPDGFVYRTTFTNKNQVNEWFNNMSILLGETAPKNAVFYYGRRARSGDLEMFVLTPSGWATALFSNPDSTGDAMTLGQDATHWTDCKSPLLAL